MYEVIAMVYRCRKASEAGKPAAWLMLRLRRKQLPGVVGFRPICAVKRTAGRCKKALEDFVNDTKLTHEISGVRVNLDLRHLGRIECGRVWLVQPRAHFRQKEQNYAGSRFVV